MNAELVAMDILETANLKHKNNEYTLSLAQQKNDSTRYAYIVQNNVTNRNTKYEFSDEASQDFKFFRGESLFEYLPKQIQLDLDMGVI